MDKIKLDTAILAKEKGFGIDYKDDLSMYKLAHDQLAPTQTELQDWLREIHGIHVVVFPFSFSGLQDEDISMRWNYRTYKLPIYSGSITSIVDTCHFTTYNEALEAVLFKALNLL
jgi:hypothetical protein